MQFNGLDTTELGMNGLMVHVLLLARKVGLIFF